MLRAASPMPLFENNLSHRVALTEAISAVMMRRTALHGLIDLAFTAHGPNVSWKAFIATSLADHIPLNAGPQEFRRFSHLYNPLDHHKEICPGAGWEPIRNPLLCSYGGHFLCSGCNANGPSIRGLSISTLRAAVWDRISSVPDQPWILSFLLCPASPIQEIVCLLPFFIGT